MFGINYSISLIISIITQTPAIKLQNETRNLPKADKSNRIVVYIKKKN